ncbi:MAG: hypothetical protein IKH45_07760 [Neisseriaceae bacterium]|nr:hypothetical protein [Neisseriaceae bacterium]
MKKLFVISSLLLLAACSSNAPVTQTQTSVNYNPENQARVRLYGQNGHPTVAWYGIDCDSERLRRGIKINVGGGGVGQAFSSFIGTVKSESIGIPETEISRNVGQQNGILSKAFFQEIAVPAGLPINVQSSFVIMGSAYNKRCRTKIGSFIPEAGKDYEIVGTVGDRKEWCSVAAYEVAQDGSTTPVQWNARAVCSKRR